MNKPNCCPKCIEHRNVTTTVAYSLCINAACECHTEKAAVVEKIAEEWENEALRLISRCHSSLEVTEMEESRDETLSFIRTEIAAAEQRGRISMWRDLSLKIKPLAEKFIKKVESGKAKSKETYEDMKEIVKLFN